MDINESFDAVKRKEKCSLSALSGADAWLLPELLSADVLLDALSCEFGLDAVPEYCATVVYADSFDWRLFRQGCLLHCRGACWTMYHDGSGNAVVQHNGPEIHDACSAADFPRGRLREMLEPVLGARCLLPMAAVHLSGRRINLLNRDGKTVARILIETRQPADDNRRWRIIRLFRVRGYEGEEEAIRHILAENGVAETISPLIGFEEGCRAKGRNPLDYSSKFSLELDGADTARKGMTRIYQALLETIFRNMPGVLADYDTEFLHDLRVAIRRTRSGLSLVKRVLPDPAEERFRREFSRLGALTGPVRDLDVFLLAENDCLARLSPFLQPGIKNFFVGLRRKRQVERKKLARALQAGKNRAVLNAWQRVLKRRDRQPAELAGTPVRELADRIILKRYGRVAGRILSADTPDTELHRLRVRCKKLRYAMEFFGSLYPEQELQTIIRHLKRLQDILGRINDLSVQREMLRLYLTNLPVEARRTPGQAAAAGALLQSLYQEQQSLRPDLTEAFTQFGDKDAASLVYELFR